MSMHNFIIEYAKMRQKEIELEFNAIKAAKQARSKKLEACYGSVLGKLGGLLCNYGQKLKRGDHSRIIRNSSLERCNLSNK